MDEKAVAHLDAKGFDIIMVNDYTELDVIEDTFDQYQEKYLVAWSMGVWAAAQTTTFIDFDKAIAINGTQDPVDDHQGIPPTIFQGTITNWDEKSRNKFILRILGSKASYQTFGEKLKKRNPSAQKEELISIQNHIENGYTYTRHFDCSIIGQKDAIFAPKNQQNAWKNTFKKELDIPHYPFEYFDSWQEILNV